jgi:hypothetical protein
MWAPKAAVADGESEGRDAHHTVIDAFELQTGPTLQQLARNSASTFVAKLDGQGMGVAAAAMNDTFSRDLWSQSVFVEAFIMKGGLPLMCRLASAASDDALFYQYYPGCTSIFVLSGLLLIQLRRCFQVFEKLCRSGHVVSFCQHGGIRLISRAIASYRGSATLLRHNALSCISVSASRTELVQRDWPNSDIVALLVELSMSVHFLRNVCAQFDAVI